MSPRSQKQIEQIRSQSIKKILDAAFELIAKHGYEATSISQIAKSAGVSKGLMYNYFDSKEDLLKELINNALAEGDRLMKEAISADPSETLKNIFVWFFNELRKHPKQWRLITELMLKIDKFEFVSEVAKRKMGDYVVFIAGLLEEIGFPNPKEEAQLISGLFDGIGIQYLVVHQDYPLDEMETYLINKYCNY
ncbi:MAG: TetR/AcrR family transcriptional regulator [Cytophagales bacterium]|nr:TetR/AcrR family transcriptional regulator [Cytophagales bacterium]